MRATSRLYPWISVTFDEAQPDTKEMTHHCSHCGVSGTFPIDDNLTAVKSFEAKHGMCRKQEKKSKAGLTMMKKLWFLVLCALVSIGCAPVCTEPVQVTRAECCDGTRAACTGPGCCSYHGGVCYTTRTEQRQVQCPEMAPPVALVVDSGVQVDSGVSPPQLDFSCMRSSQCPIGSRCINGMCDLFTRNFDPSAPTNCGGRWVNTNIDSRNCGRCGFACAEGESCQFGRCTTCSAIYGFNWNMCDFQCVDFSYDATNCGGCGRSCPSEQACYMGTCSL